MQRDKLWLICDNGSDQQFTIEVKQAKLAIEIFGNLFVSGLSWQQKNDVKMTAKFPLTTLQAARIAFWARSGCCSCT